MDKDSIAILKFAVAVIIIAVLLIIWFMTIGAPGGEEDDAAIATELVNAIPSKLASYIPFL